MAELRAAASTGSTADQLWSAITDWPGQSRWIPLTRARKVGGPDGVGARIDAWTGVGRLGFVDTMVVEVWRPPHELVLRHTGRVVRGRAGFSIAPTPAGSRLVWWEQIELPLGALGRILWPVAAPFAAAVLRRSLRRVAAIAAE